MSFAVVEIDNLIFGADGSGTLTANNRGVLLAGKDGTTPRFLVVDSTGRLVFAGAGVAGTPAGGVASVQGVAGGTALPISAAALPLPTGAATETTLASLLTLAGFQARINTLGQKAMAASTPVVIASDQSPLGVTGPLTDAQLRATAVPVSTSQLPSALVGSRLDTNVGAWLGSTAPTVGQKAMAASLPVTLASDQTVLVIGGDEETGFYPDPSVQLSGAQVAVKIDSDGSLRTRGPVTTDERSFRDDFPGTSLNTALTGTVTFANGSPVVTGAGTSFSTELKSGQYIKRTVDADTFWVLVASVDSNTQLTLEAPYGGISGTGGHVTNFFQALVGTATLTVANSLLTLTSGTTSGNSATITRFADYGPIILQMRLSISQRIANQTGIFGFADNWTTPGCRAQVVFDGTNNRVLKFRTGAGTATADVEETQVVLPVGLDTSQTLFYQIDLEPHAVTLLINGERLAQHTRHIPAPYDVMVQGASLTNTAVAGSSTTMVMDVIFFSNQDKVEIRDSFNGTPLQVQSIGGYWNSGVAFGYQATAAVARFLMQATAYTEQTADAQRQLISSSANDTAAGTGARTIRLVYYNSLGEGPFTEVITLNGTTAVNTVNTNICFIESMEVETVGATGSNAGTITLRTLAAVAIWSIAAGDNRTYAARHYVPRGKTCFVTDLRVGSTQTSIANGSRFQLFVTPIGSGLAERPLSGFLQMVGTAGNSSAAWASPLAVAGPAKIQCYVNALNAAATTQHAEFAFYEVP